MLPVGDTININNKHKFIHYIFIHKYSFNHAAPGDCINGSILYGAAWMEIAFANSSGAARLPMDVDNVMWVRIPPAPL